MVSRACAAGLPLGLHLNLTEGLPVCPGTATSSLCDLSDGQQCFRGKHGLRIALLADEVEEIDLAAEVEAQLRRFRRWTGHMPRFIDGHQHVHVLPGIPDILVKAFSNVQGERSPSVKSPVERKPWIRLPSLLDEPDPSEVPDAMSQALDPKQFHALIHSYCEVAWKCFEGAGWHMPTRFVGYTVMGLDMSPDRILEEVRRAETQIDAPRGVFELMTHPGIPVPPDSAKASGCGTGADAFSQSHARQHELDVLCSACQSPAPLMCVVHSDLHHCTGPKLLSGLRGSIARVPTEEDLRKMPTPSSAASSAPGSKDKDGACAP